MLVFKLIPNSFLDLPFCISIFNLLEIVLFFFPHLNTASPFLGIHILSCKSLPYFLALAILDFVCFFGLYAVHLGRYYAFALSCQQEEILTNLSSSNNLFASWGFMLQINWNRHIPYQLLPSNAAFVILLWTCQSLIFYIFLAFIWIPLSYLWGLVFLMNLMLTFMSASDKSSKIPGRSQQVWIDI